MLEMMTNNAVKVWTRSLVVIVRPRRSTRIDGGLRVPRGTIEHVGNSEEEVRSRVGCPWSRLQNIFADFAEIAAVLQLVKE